MALLALFDLDNTLIDRAGAFRSWARGFLESRALDPEELDWLERVDADGLRPRPEFFEEVRGRYRLDDSVDDLVAAYRDAYPRSVEPAGKATLDALGELRARGWRIGIVSNGAATQEAKIDAAGLRDAVDGWAISEVVGVRKPDPQIFHAAALACGCGLEGAWVVGDSAAADVAGAAACGLRSIWIRRGRRWPDLDRRPDRVAEDVPDAVRQILSAAAA